MTRLPRSRRVRHVLSLLAALLVLAGLVGGPAARGQEEPALGGYQVTASAAGIAAIYDQPSAGFVSGSEFSLARTIATIDAGPSGRALASALWPGDFLANIPPVVSGEVKKGCEGRCDFLPDFPAYPMRAESFFPQGPERQDSGIQGVTMVSVARQDLSDADAAGVTVRLPAVVSARNVGSASTTRREGALTISEGAATASGVSVLDGLITAESVVTTARATSDGVAAKVAGGVRVTGLRIQGNEASIDEKGVHLFGNDTGPIGDAINELSKSTLESMGVSLALAGPIDVIDGASASRTVGGLVVGVRPGALGDVVPNELRDLSITVVIGGATVAASATRVLPVSFDVPPPPPATSVAGTAIAAPFEPALPGGAAPAPVVAQPAAIPVGAEPVPVSGVPAALVGAFIALALVLSRQLRLFADRVTAGRAVTICPLGEEK